MKIRTIECPNCDSNITISKSGIHRCSFCSHELYAEEKNADVIINTTINHYARPGQSSKSSSGRRAWKASLLALCLFSVSVFALLFFVFTDNPSGSRQKSFYEERFNESVQSPKMIRFVEIAYKKKIDEIQRSDYEKMKSIRFVAKDHRNSNFEIQYQLEDGTSGAVSFLEPSFSNNKEIPLTDFQCFTNLEVLDFNNSPVIERYYLRQEKEFVNGLHNLTKLKEFGGQLYANIDDYPEILHDPSKLTYISGGVFDKETASSSLSLFTNLEKIKITYINDEALGSLHALSKLEHLKIVTTRLSADNSYLTAISNLKELYLDSNSDIKDYQFLNGLPNLETLEINDALELKSLQFLEGMPNLKRLSVESSIIRDLSPLQEKESLEVLSLENNQEIKDYSIITTLKNLKRLTIGHWAFNRDIRVPALERLTKLTTLNMEGRMIKYVNLPESIDSLTLYIRLADEFDLENIPKLEQLQNLVFFDSGYLVNAHAIHRFPNLKTLTFYQSRLWRFDLSEILNSSTLEHVALHDVMSFMIKPSSIRENKVMKTFHLHDVDDVYVFRGSINDNVTEKHKVGEISEAFANLHAMQTLSLVDCDIDDLSFVKEMKELKFIDLSKNYISDVSPLTQAQKLEKAILIENPVANAHLLGSKIYRE